MKTSQKSTSMLTKWFSQCLYTFTSMSLLDPSSLERTSVLLKPPSSLSSPSFTVALEGKLNKSKVCDILQRELLSDHDDGRVKMFRLVCVCVYKKNNRKSKTTLSTNVMLLESNIERMFDICKTEMIHLQESFQLSKPQHVFNEIFTCHLETLTMYTL